MDDRMASLLTKTQRRRVRNDFADLDEQKRRRDERQIRKRLAAGLLDTRVLAGYPDAQLGLAVEDLSEDELREALADATLVLERVREMEGVDRKTVLSRARCRADELAEQSGDLRSLDDLDLQTAAEIRRETKVSVREQFEENRWDSRADGLLKLTASATVPLFVTLLVDSTTSRDLLGTSAGATVLVYLCSLVVVVALSGVFLIKAAQTLKHDVLPAVLTFRRDPASAVASALDLLRRPGERLRKIWDEL
ncbi:hypothetical protein [Halorussus sp. MSC15.2]|uniref:hypothetical protein n=1 Tax=Halorussus sp. MSC15.2 TaxID=2283638 RepID=UPI0013D3D549|nr:hypothetical protein [Halorussus sp. MSC15.2]NEU55442.1 hypothetical protein [Halorussus sp. MSC15.2]